MNLILSLANEGYLTYISELQSSVVAIKRDLDEKEEGESSEFSVQFGEEGFDFELNQFNLSTFSFANETKNFNDLVYVDELLRTKENPIQFLIDRLKNLDNDIVEVEKICEAKITNKRKKTRTVTSSYGFSTESDDNSTFTQVTFSWITSIMSFEHVH